MKDIKEELNKWRDTPCSWIERLNIIKMLAHPNFVHRINEIPIKIPAGYFIIYRFVLKFIWRSTRPRITNTILKENKAEGLMLPEFKTYHKATVIKTVWYWWKNRQISGIEQRTHKEKPVNNWFVNWSLTGSKGNTMEQRQSL